MKMACWKLTLLKLLTGLKFHPKPPIRKGDSISTCNAGLRITQRSKTNQPSSLFITESHRCSRDTMTYLWSRLMYLSRETSVLTITSPGHTTLSKRKTKITEEMSETILEFNTWDLWKEAAVGRSPLALPFLTRSKSKSYWKLRTS